MVRKILRSLYERSRLKVIAIEESKNMDMMRVGEFIAFLFTYDMTLLSITRPKKIALKVSSEEKIEFDDDMNYFSYIY